MVAAGMGVSLVPSSTIFMRNSGVVYRPLKGPTPTLDLALAWLAGDDDPVVWNVVDVARGLAR
jgi:DNA-binding transcriptional LysR family regulator